MRIEPQRPLFVGVRIDNKLRDALASCPPRDKAYFDGSDPRYLRVLRAVEDSYIGKVVDAGPTAVSLEDLKRNILSLLNRLGGRRSDDDVRVFACDEGEPPPLPTPSPPPDRHY